MSIIIHFNTASFIPQSTALSSNASSLSRARGKLAMVPAIDETDQTVMTDDESSLVDIATSNTLYTHAVNDLKNHNVFGSCFGLPYQDHNYGAPPPPTPPSYSPYASPAHANGVPDEDTNLSIVSTSTIHEETQERSITRCICGFEQDDEYMICCDRCLVWQHVDCMGLDRNNIPETYLCEKCAPRKVDRHKAKVLQTRKKVAMTDSSDSEEDTGTKNTERKPKNRKRRRKEDVKSLEKAEQVFGKRNKHMNRHTKERIEAKRSKLRRTKNKESTSTADEEAQDAWEISLEWCEKNFETALNNQYTPEVQQLAKTLSMLGHEQRFIELLLTRNCQVIDGIQKKVISVYDIPRDQPLIEYKGKFLLASQFYELHPAFSKRLFPFVMFYTFDQEEICVDASVYGNEARFIRRSCKPNAEMRHLVYHGNLHLYVSSTKAVFKDDEITLPLDFTLKESIKDIECACESEECILKFHPKNGNLDMSPDKKKKGRKLLLSADDDSSHSFLGIHSASPTKGKPVRSLSQISDTTDGKSDHETEEQVNERKKKTREERKIDAIMKAFDQMEKAAKRRQQALERQKAHHPKLEETSEKSESISLSKDDDKVATASGSETQGCEEEKPLIPTQRTKKGKRRRGSGTSARRRTRTNSGGSDVFIPEENALTRSAPVTDTDIVSISDSIVEAVSITTTTTTTTTCSTLTLSPVLSNAPTSPAILKTKRFLLHEWLQEKSEVNTNPSATSPVSIRAEVKWNTPSPTSSICYVQCTKDNPYSAGISAAHLRRSSTSSQIKSLPLKSYSEQGFTKKRWLRQAMFDGNSCKPLTIDPGGIESLHLDSGCLSPTCHGEMGSPGAADDTITPLKKRRLLRESTESISSPMSPTTQGSECCSADLNSMSELNFKTETDLDDSDQQLLHVKTESSDAEPTLASKEHSFCKMNGIRVDYSRSPKEIIEEVYESIKEETNSCETTDCAPISPECPASDTADSKCKVLESSMQSNCALEDKMQDYLINYSSLTASIYENSVDVTQSKCEDNKASVSDRNVSFVDSCPGEKLQSNSETENNVSDDKTCKNICFENVSERSSEKYKNLLSDNSNVQSSLPVDICSSSTGSFQIKTDTIVCHSDVKTFETVIEHTMCKYPENIVHNIKSENSLNQPVTCGSTKDKPPSNLIPQHIVDYSSVSPIKSSDISLTNYLDSKSEQRQSDVNLQKNLLADCTADKSEELCSVNIQPEDTDCIKTREFTDLDSKTSLIFNESSDSTIKINASAIQKRKVSLSEYRLRMKDGPNQGMVSKGIKRSTNCPATAIPETLPERVTLAPLPLFDTAVGSKSPPQTPISIKNSKKKKEITKSEESMSDVTEYRENLTERLKREFGFDDDSGVSQINDTKSITGSTSMPSCAQLPPPPPPPPPRSIRSSQTNLSVASTSQFDFNMSTQYARPSYIVPQVPSAQFIPVQQTVTLPVMPSIHPISTPGVQCNIQTTLLPSPHSYAPLLSGTILQPSIQHEFSSVNAQNFAALVQQPPPLPPPKSYPHVYQPGLYK